MDLKSLPQTAYTSLNSETGQLSNYVGSPSSAVFEPGSDEFAFIQLPDIHSTNQPLSHVTFDWIINSWRQLKVRAVIMPGDLVTDPNNVGQWDYIAWEIGRLRAAGITVFPTAGNHDWLDGSKTHWNTRVPLGFFTWKQPEFLETMTPGDSMNLAFRFTVAGLPILLIGLAANVGADWPEPRAWALDLAKRYNDHYAILVTHAYLNNVGQLQQPGDPNYYRGHKFWEELVKLAPNIRQVMCGHTHTPTTGWWHLTQTADAGHKVLALNFDTQEFANGGDDYLRLYQWKLGHGRIDATTYRVVDATTATVVTTPPVAVGNEPNFVSTP